MSDLELDAESSPMRTKTPHRNAVAQNDDTTLDDDAAAANNSIIGKVKSRVSSIFPNSLSKWFSPSTKNNSDSLNGSLNSGGITSRRRRRLEVEEDEDEEEVDEVDDEDQEPGEYDGNILTHAMQNDDNSDDDDESNNSEEAAPVNRNTSRTLLRSCAAVRPPPSKRYRLNLDITTRNSLRNTAIMQRPSVVASTPAAMAHSSAAAGRTGTNRYKHLNLYSNQGINEPAFNFHPSSAINATSAPKNSRYESATATDIIDLVPEQAIEMNMQSDIISSRRSLNIPSLTQASTERYSGFSNLKRQSLASVKQEFSNSTSLPRRTSTALFETECVDVVRPSQQHHNIIEEEQEYELNDVDGDDDVRDKELQQPNTFNGQGEASQFKRQKLTNGARNVFKTNNNNTLTTAAANARDSASESSDGGGCNKAETSAGSSGQNQRKAGGLFNMSTANSRNGSRTSSFGNGLNFYSHLEGRKSLFAGNTQAELGGQTLNNSTLSLTSLNRRQFNASIYGSTSALSDSRLLNTFSPFYKGKTTYGGAAAYNKYAMGSQVTGTGAGASNVRITPTLIRPTSSLSTLSSSNNSLAAVAGTNAVTVENSSAISSTAKRILDLINDFATPLSEAKKMASNLKQQQQYPQTKVHRFNETDLNSTRAMRLSQVRTPYMRPTVTLLQPTTKPNGRTQTAIPPVRELQVPSMSQLLQMKKMQSTTERSRQIATENNRRVQEKTGTISSSAYTLPVELLAASAADDNDNRQLRQHTNKIKSKITSSVRITSSKDAAAAIANEAPPEAVNLPNIAFPLMQSVPKFDITLPSKAVVTKSPAGDASTTPKFAFSSSRNTTSAMATSAHAIKPTVTATSSSSAYIGDSNKKAMAMTAEANANIVATAATVTNFIFSTPLKLAGISTPTQNITPINGNYKFSPPMLVNQICSAIDTTLSSSPARTQQFKTGSVLDALKKPFEVPVAAATETETKTAATGTLFAAQFKKSASEWDCDTCMIRNKEAVLKCVACETPRKNTTSIASTTTMSSPTTAKAPLSLGFGSQFKKSSNEWECDACMIRNKESSVKCVACETPRKGVVSAVPSNPASSVKNTFGDAFKPSTNTWELYTCLKNNTSADKSGAHPNSKTNADAGMKSIAAAQKVSKWECETCMTLNDAARQKCVCCEQAKPGTHVVSENVPKFSFGSTATAKFSFGFGSGAAPKEEELRKLEMTTKKTETKSGSTTTVAGSGFVFGAAAPATTSTSSGVKPQVDTAAKSGIDIADSSKTAASVPALTGFKFGATSGISAAASTTSTTIATTTAATTPLVSATTAAKATTTSNLNSSPSVKFSLPTTTSDVGQKPAAPAVATATPPPFAFGSNTATTFKPVQQAAAPGFSFGISKNVAAASKPVTIAATTATTTAGFAFKAPITTTAAAPAVSSTSSFAFGSAATTTVATTAATTATQAAVKPMFSFGSTASQATTGGFSFGNSPAASSAPAAAAKSLFGAATSTNVSSSLFGVATSTPNAASTNVSSSTTAAPAPNVFSSFASATVAPSPVFGTASPNVSSSTPTNSSANLTFGSLASSGATPFTAFGSSDKTIKPATAPATSLFGVGASSATSVPSSTPFAFGSGATAAVPAAANSTTNNTSSSTWPKNSFVFGNAAAGATVSTSNEGPKPSTFGSFGSATLTSAANAANSTAAASSIFGNLTSTSSTNMSAPANTFGNTAAVTPLFGSGSTAPSASSNLFGSAVAANSNGATATAHAFGSSRFGNVSTVAAPTFGSTAAAGCGNSGGSATTNTFGGFGAPTPATSSSDGASAAKKSEPAFNFGATHAAPQSTSGGFNFGSAATATKQAFNFGSSNAATASFNFTGSSEAAPNAPFQFNAGAAPPTNSNIFAPTPTAPGVQAGQQTRRKVRAAVRRLTPR